MSAPIIAILVAVAWVASYAAILRHYDRKDMERFDRETDAWLRIHGGEQ